MTTFTLAPRARKQRAHVVKKRATRRFAMHGLTENGLTVAEEREILRIWNDLKTGKTKAIPAEEVWRKLGLEN